MTEEQMREKITQLENDNKTLTENFNTVNDQIKVKDEQITSLNSTVSDLKQKNYDLFIQVSKPIDNTQETKTETQEKTMSVADITSKLLGGK